VRLSGSRPQRQSQDPSFRSRTRRHSARAITLSTFSSSATKSPSRSSAKKAPRSSPRDPDSASRYAQAGPRACIGC